MARTKRRLRDLAARAGDRRGGVAIMVALVVVALMGMLALAMDVSAAVSAHTRLREAADVAALTAVRQAAVLTAANSDANLDPARNAGLQRFTAQASNDSRVTVDGVSVQVQRDGLTITSTVRFNATYATQVAGVLNAISPSMTSFATLPLGGQVGARQQVGAFVDIQVLMDTSNSMTIAVADSTSTSDTTNLKALTTRWPWYSWCNSTPAPTNTDPNPVPCIRDSMQQFAPRVTWTNCQFACHATLIPDVGNWWLQSWALAPSNAPYTMLTSAAWMGSSTDPTAVPDPNTYPDGRLTDFYTLAKKNGITLRIDVLKQAVNKIVDAASTSVNASMFQFGFYTFDVDSQQVFPLGSASGASAAVSGTEVTPYVWPQDTASQTNVAQSIRDFDANYASQAGDGSSPQQPKKYVVILTDGIEDFTSGGNREYAPFDPTACDGMKAKGIGVIVLQAASLANFISGDDPQALFNASVTAMKQCASSPSYYFLASDPVDILAATQQIINLTMSQPTMITRGDTSTVKQ